MPAPRRLRAWVVNTSLKRRHESSHTGILLEAICRLFEKNEVDVEYVHFLDHKVPPGIQPDMTHHGWDEDEWPALWKQVLAADILVIGTPIWLGEESSACRVLIERLYAMSALRNEQGQSIFYGKVGGCVVTGNEDGIKHIAMSLTFALSHLGYTVPPQADCGWVGEAGPGPSFGDRADSGGRIGFDNEFTQRNATIMTWNLIHFARMIRDAGGIPTTGNDRDAWDRGERFGFELPVRELKDPV